MSAKSLTVPDAWKTGHTKTWRYRNVMKTGGHVPSKTKPYPEWRQRIDTSKGMSILG